MLGCWRMKRLAPLALTLAALAIAGCGGGPVDGRVVLDVGGLVGLKPGDNPHQWYSPQTVQRVIDQIVSDYKRLDPKDAAYFDRRRRIVETRNLGRYHALIAQIRARYRGTP